MYITLDPNQGDNTNVFQNLNTYRGEENIPEGDAYLTPGCQAALSRQAGSLGGRRWDCLRTGNKEQLGAKEPQQRNSVDSSVLVRLP